MKCSIVSLPVIRYLSIYVIYRLYSNGGPTLGDLPPPAVMREYEIPSTCAESFFAEILPVQEWEKISII